MTTYKIMFECSIPYFFMTSLKQRRHRLDNLKIKGTAAPRCFRCYQLSRVTVKVKYYSHHAFHKIIFFCVWFFLKEDKPVKWRERRRVRSTPSLFSQWIYFLYVLSRKCKTYEKIYASQETIGFSVQNAHTQEHDIFWSGLRIGIRNF